MEATEETTSLLVSSAAGGSFIAGIFAGEYIKVWRLINTLQILVVLNFINVETHPILQDFLSGLLDETRILNIYAYFFNYYDQSEMPSRFTRFRYNFPSFLDITGHIITVLIGGTVLFGIT